MTMESPPPDAPELPDVPGPNPKIRRAVVAVAVLVAVLAVGTIAAAMFGGDEQATSSSRATTSIPAGTVIGPDGSVISGPGGPTSTVVGAPGGTGTDGTGTSGIGAAAGGGAGGTGGTGAGGTGSGTGGTGTGSGGSGAGTGGQPSDTSPGSGGGSGSGTQPSVQPTTPTPPATSPSTTRVDEDYRCPQLRQVMGLDSRLEDLAREIGCI